MVSIVSIQNNFTTTYNASAPKVFTAPVLAISAASNFVVKKIAGLEAPKSNLLFSDQALDSPDKLVGVSTPSRSIDILIGYRPDWSNSTKTITGLRESIQKTILPGCQYRFFFDNYWIDGVVETVQPNIYTENPELLISIICPFSGFRKTAGPITIPLPAKTNDGLPYNLSAYDLGTGNSGMIFKGVMSDNGAVKASVISNGVENDLVFRVNIGSTTVNTIPGQKSVTSTGSGPSILNYLESSLVMSVNNFSKNSFVMKSLNSAGALVPSHNFYAGSLIVDPSWVSI